MIEPLKRGLVATEEDREAVEAVVRELEAVNPTKKPLESPLLNGRWRLVRDLHSQSTRKPLPGRQKGSTAAIAAAAQCAMRSS